MNPLELQSYLLHSGISTNEITRDIHIHTFSFNNDFKSEIYMKTFLAFYGQCSIDEIKLKRDHNGKPYCTSHPELSFNISHSAETFAFAIGKRRKIGIDLENYKELDDLETLIAFSFTENEQRFIKRSKQPQDAFINLWALKEAYIKAVGVGWGLEPTSIDMELRKDFSVSEITINDSFIEEDYRIEIAEFSDDYPCAICYSGSKANISLYAADRVAVEVSEAV